MLDTKEFELDLRTLERGTRFFDCTDKFFQPFDRRKHTFIDEDGNEWYRYDNPVQMWTMIEYEYLGPLNSFFNPDPDTPKRMIEDFANLYANDVYVRNVETGNIHEIFAHRNCASVDKQRITEAIEEANKDHS